MGKKKIYRIGKSTKGETKKKVRKRNKERKGEGEIKQNEDEAGKKRKKARGECREE